jgi:REP element-mobilizing transposase RayT
MVSKFDPQKHHRRSIRLPGYDYTGAGGYYVTIVAHNRTCLFGEIVNGEMSLNNLGQIAKREWARLPKRFKHVELGVYVIMPNRIHGIILIDDSRRGTADFANTTHTQDLRRAPTQEHFGKPVSGSIPTIIRSYKSAVALRIHYAQPNDDSPIWQRNYYEHVIRNTDDANRIHTYIESNPANWDIDKENSSLVKR